MQAEKAEKMKWKGHFQWALAEQTKNQFGMMEATSMLQDR